MLKNRRTLHKQTRAIAWLFYIAVLGTSFYIPAKKYLPVHIGLPDSARHQKDLQIWLRVAFKKYNIKIISKKEVESYTIAEVQNTLLPYIQAGGNPADYEKIKAYLSLHQHLVANSISLRLLLDEAGQLTKPVSWRNATIPIDMATFKAKPYKTLQPDSSCLSSLQQLTQCIADSIVASGELATEN